MCALCLERLSVSIFSNSDSRVSPPRLQNSISAFRFLRRTFSGETFFSFRKEKEEGNDLMLLIVADSTLAF